MKTFSIGDGDKKISCPDRYLADEESGTTVVIWDPENRDMPIRVTVITITHKDSSENEAAYWGIIEDARKKGIQPQVVGNKAFFSYQQPSNEEGYKLHFFQAGMRNHHAIFSITVATAEEQSDAFATVRRDLLSMIESWRERKPEEQFDCHLEQCEEKRISDSSKELLNGRMGEEAWKLLGQHYEGALEKKDRELASKIGLAFGESLRREVPSFHWKVKIDDYGRSKSLDFGEEKISIFPESMILKRYDREEIVDFADLSSGTIEAVENLYRRYQSESEK